MRRRLLVIGIVGVGLLLIAASCPVMNSRPVARFTRDPSSGEAPLTVSFDGSQSYDSDGQIASYSWFFGDGSTGSGAAVLHTYNLPGDYTARLTVRDDKAASGDATRSISVTQPTTPRYSVTVGQILQEFESNEYAAEMKYQGQVVAVSGYTQRIGIDMLDQPLVVLNEHPGGSTFDDAVIGKFPVGDHPDLAQLLPDDYVTVIGEYNMYGLGNVYLRNCYLE